MFRRVLFWLALSLFAPVASSAALNPVAQVERNKVACPGDPQITVTVPASAKYLGADRFILKELSDCETSSSVLFDLVREANVGRNPKAHSHPVDIFGYEKVFSHRLIP